MNNKVIVSCHLILSVFIVTFIILMEPHTLKASNIHYYKDSTESSTANDYNEMQGSLLFMENKGQILDKNGNKCKDILFMSKTEGLKIIILDNAIQYQFEKIESRIEFNSKSDFRENTLLKKNSINEHYPLEIETYSLKMQLLGANPSSLVEKGIPQNYFENYYNIPSNPEGILGVKAYNKIILKEVYPGIDWIIYSEGESIKYDFIVHPGANPNHIKIQYQGAENIILKQDGNLQIKTPLGEIEEFAPISYSGDNKIASHFLLHDETISFHIPSYNPDIDLIIDPSLVWATYYGGTMGDYGYGTTTDLSGNVYLTGYTASNNGIASSGTVHDNMLGGVDAFLVKFNASGTRLWGTYYGGSDQDFSRACATDGAGNIYLAGKTCSLSGISSGGFQNTFGGGSGCGDFFGGDAFLIKFNPSGVRQWGTYYGGSEDDEGFSVCTDAVGNVYMAGYTSSTNNIASGGHDNSFGGLGDAFLVKFNTAGMRLWGTYYGGSGSDGGEGAATDLSGNVYLAGRTQSNNSIASNGHQTTFGGGTEDAFLVKFNTSGIRQWGTYYGGVYGDAGYCVATDGLGNVYLGGSTNSTTGIATPNGHDTTLGEIWDAFLVKFNAAGTRQWGTYYGGLNTDGGKGVATDGSNNVYLAGNTNSDNSIAFGGHQNTFGGGENDAFLVKFNTSGIRQWGTYYGGSNSDIGHSIALSTEYVYLAGLSNSNNNIAYGNVHQSTIGGDYDAFLAKFQSGSTINLCQGATTLICGVTYSGSTAGGPNNFNASSYTSCYSSSATFSAADRVFSIQKSSTAGDLVVTLFSNYIDHDIFLFNQCNSEVLQCIGYSTGSVGNGINFEVIRIPNAPSGTYFIVVDGYTTSEAGAFDLTVTCGNLSCVGATPITCNQPLFNQTNSAGENNVSTYCNQSAPDTGAGCTGKEKVYSFVVNQAQPVTINLTGVDPEEDFELFLLSSCNKDACLANSTNLPGENELITYNLGPGTYYIVVDGFRETVGNYNLSISCCTSQAYIYDCDNLSYSYTGSGSQLQFTFNSEGQTLAPGYTWTVNTQSINGATNTSFTYNFPSAGNYDICFPYFDINGCLQYCCNTFCITLPSYCYDDILYSFNDSNEQIVFNLENANQYQNITWFWDDAPGVILGSSANISLSLPQSCIARTISVRYFDPGSGDGCWRLCCRTIWLCNPFDCKDFSYSYVSASNGFQFNLALTGATNITWTVDDHPQGALSIGTGTLSSIYPVPSPCAQRTITVRYFWEGSWRLCCRRIWLCNPFDCGTISFNYEPNQGYQFTFTQGNYSYIEWLVEQTGQSLGNNLVSSYLSIPIGCVMRTISIRYFDIPNNRWRICCINIWLCNPTFCADNISFDVGQNGTVNLQTNQSFQDITWFNGNQQIGIGSSISQQYPLGSTQLIYLRYFDPSTGRYQICCRQINIPTCELPLPDFNYSIAGTSVTFTNTTTGTVNSYLWNFGNGNTSTAGNPPAQIYQTGNYQVCLTTINSCGSSQHCDEITIIDPANIVIFDISDNICGSQGQIIEVPFSVSNFNNVINFQMSITLSDPNFGTLLEIVPQSILPGASFNVVNSNTGALLWFSATPVSLADSSVIGILRIQITGVNGSSTMIEFSDNPLPVYLEIEINNSVVSIPPILVDGSACIYSVLQLCGKVTREDNVGISNVTIGLGGDASQSAITDSQGNYCFQNIDAGGNYTLTPDKDINYLNGVNSGDLSKIQRHILGVEFFNSSYKIIAANSKNPIAINSGDLSEIQKLILGIISDFPDVDSWRFIPKSYSFPIPQQPFNPAFPESISLNNVTSDMTNLDFIGVKIGDVTLNNNPENIAQGSNEIASQHRSGDLELFLTSTSIAEGQEFEIPLSVIDFQDMYAMQFSLNWDPTKIQFIEITHPNSNLNISEDNFNTNLVGQGQLGFLWWTANQSSLPDSTNVFFIKFRAIGANGTTTNVLFSDNPTTSYFENIIGEIQSILSGSTIMITYSCTTSDLAIASILDNGDGTATVTAIGGSPPYSFVWSNGQIGQTATNLASGNYFVSVSDSIGCTIEGSVNVISGSREINTLENLLIYPNPTIGSFTIDIRLASNENIQINIINSSGEILRVIQGTVLSEKYIINMNGEPGGLYLIKINIGANYLVRRLIVYCD
jgi:PKD repeat protein